jgi:protein-L-isoaspartate(D-aspartate) O-methyltransferase
MKRKWIVALGMVVAVLVLVAHLLRALEVDSHLIPRDAKSLEEQMKTSEEEEKRFEESRLAMVEEQIERRGIKDKRVLAVLRKVARHKFVPLEYRRSSYRDSPLPIGLGQTISQPYIVALMTELLNLKPEHKALEIGTGSGYQAAILAELAKEVYTIEIYKALGEAARMRLEKLGYKNIQCKVDDGYFGWEKHAPFDAIIVTCAADHIPPALIKQLKPDGRMCIPVGPVAMVQRLLLVEKSEDGKLRSKDIASVRFVPLVRKKGE